VTVPERENLLTGLLELFEECGKGQERVAVVTGVAGSGKTWLIRTFVEKAIAGGAIWCAATASRVEQGLQFGVLSQLFVSAELPAEFREQAIRLLKAGSIAVNSRYFDNDDADGGEIPLTTVQNLGILLREVMARADRPLLMTIDDAHNADAASLHCLSSVVSRLWRSPLMLVISAAGEPQPFNPVFLADLPPEPYSRRIRLDPLSTAGVRAMLAGRLGEATAGRLAADCHRISGGNPALVRGLIDDCRWQGGEPDKWQLSVGAEVAQVLLGLLHRSDPSLLRVARWLAVLSNAAAGVVGRLAGLDGESLARTLSALNQIGVLDEGQFRHPRLAAAVLHDLDSDERVSMHARAAELLRLEGADAPIVADHVVGADGHDAEWAVLVLKDAAEKVLSGGQVNRALTYLRLAYRLAGCAASREVIRALLARVEWLVDPALAMRHDADQPACGDRLLSRAMRLMWFGRAEEAQVVLQHAGDGVDQPQRDRVNALRGWLSWLYPAIDQGSSTGAALAEGFRRTAAGGGPAGQAIALLVRSLGDGTGEAAIAAERALYESRLEEETVPLLVAAVAALLYSGRLDVAAKWGDSLRQDAAAQQAPTWVAMFTAMRAMIALRQGNLLCAETHARAALALIPASSWGVSIGIPLSVLVETSTLMGRDNDTVGHLRTPVPHAMFESPLGLHYLQARGRFHLARENYSSALRDFQSIGDLAAQWQLDFPALVAWRIDAATAHLRLGQTEAARDLAHDQLKLLSPANVRERGMALRVVAACCEPPKRPIRLEQALKDLQSSRDRLQLAYALADLGQAYRALGEMGQARRISRRAYQIAKQCGAGVLARSLMPEVGGGAGSDDGDGEGAVATASTSLSHAERRVAGLAAEGYSNRQIASTLFITVSTVEQHLTRVYSKLKVSRRGELPFGLLQEAGDRSFPLPDAGRGI
jgi:DNA-binding CsgD family transcriptional regulator